jgi:glucose/arabinose dehydrogenase/putative cell wall-binding protein
MFTRAVRATAVLALALALAAIQPVNATAIPSVQLRFLARWLATAPVGIESAGDGTDRLFIVEQGGRIRLVIAGALLDAPFLDVSSKVSAGGERGLLGLAFPAGFGSKQYFYVNYTDLSGNTVIARYHVSASDPNVADPGSEQVLLTIAQPFSNHNGGHLAFGPDGYLYIGSGDGGSSGDPLGNAQRRDTLLGKILRIDTEGTAIPYDVPTSNPFVGMSGYRPEIWALGLRNPWRFSFDRGTGALWIADVGQGAREEIDYEPPGFAGGRNYGWNLYEGLIAYPSGSTPSPTVGLTFPVYEYDHTSGGQSVTGGFVYRGPSQTSLAGLYLFSDFSLGKFWVLDPADHSVQMVVDTGMQPSSFGQDEAGELYVADYASGVVYQVLDGSPGTSGVLTRLAGANRYETAVAISQAAFPSGATTVVIATGMAWPDALGGSSLAGAVSGALLLTRPAALPTEVLAEIGRLGATKAYVLGGTAAVSAAVENTLVTKLGRANVVRLGGADRYETARYVADTLLKILGTQYAGDAFVATGADFPDAAAASPLAAALGRPILLANPTSGAIYVPTGTKRAAILGSTAAVSGTVEAALRTSLGSANVVRLGGANRYATAAIIAQTGVDAGMRWDGAGIATGTDFPDALAGGTMLRGLDSVVLLTDSTTLSGEAAAALSANRSSINRVFIFGGTNAISARVELGVKSAAGL